jgi:hypothetical protein
VALLAGLLGVAAPAARAGDDSRYLGSCGFDSLSQPTVTGDSYQYTGAVYATCTIEVNGVPAWSSYPASGAGAIVLADRADYTAADTDVVRLCTTVDYTSDWTPTATHCPGATNLQMPPQPVIDLIDYVVGLGGWLPWQHVDQLACPAFGALAPGADPVQVTPEGDVYVYGERQWDCPPYAEPPRPPSPLPDTSLPTGGGWNDRDTGLLALTGGEAATGAVTAVCAFRRDPVTGTVTVTGGAVSSPDALVTVRCTLADAATGTPAYDETRTGTAAATLTGAAGSTGVLTVCTEGTATWGTRTVTTGLYCRPGRPV